MTVSTDNAASPKPTRSKNKDFSVRIQMSLKFQFKSVLRHTEESKFLDLVDFGEVAFSVESVIAFSSTIQVVFKDTAGCLHKHTCNTFV